MKNNKTNKLLVVTQVMDINHPILGFFHRWVEEFSKHYEQVQVICLQKGKYNLPANVTVYSLGKEERKGRLTYLWRFYKYIWQLRHEYHHVFVHMNQIYVILGAPFWRAVDKRVGLWYAHGAVSLSLRIAVKFSHSIFTSTEQGMVINTPKRIIVGQGIDTNVFTKLSCSTSTVHSDNGMINVFTLTPESEVKIFNLITVGRLSQSKNIETLLKACAELKANKISFHFNIIGPATTPNEELYTQKVKHLCLDLNLENNVTWIGAVTQRTLPDYLQVADVFIHDGSTDSLDKALLEAVLCGCVVVSSNPAYCEITKTLAPTLLFKPHDAPALTSILNYLYRQSETERQQIMQTVHSFVYNSYGISGLISGIVRRY